MTQTSVIYSSIICLKTVLLHFNSIGFAIASRLAKDGAKVMVSSRKQKNVDKAVSSLQSEYGNESISGTVCHVGQDEDRKRLIQEVSHTTT